MENNFKAAYLRCHEIHASAKRLRRAVRITYSLSCDAEVDELNVACGSEEQVVELEVAMYDAILVQEAEG